ncbi:hypothetical protein FHR99_002047 [Litorivivens lipolytica]|uniref:DUF4136 domain-containing protein n=1 Tax=Litorivivens lipolytica TaxID=1524264 RepID=A0A7W4W5D4_9GAMM|nr:DUF4136 domain-containing protein [Litorivivens lipolytica]MBB3047781.1 hypothetical protein [Litorivivens lipolytica]
MHRLAMPLLALLLTACSSVPVETDYNPDANFNGYQRYHWQMETSGSDSSISPFHGQRVKTTLQNLLNQQRYREANQAENPDFLIRYYLTETVEGHGHSNTRGSVGLGSGGGGFGMGVSVGFPLGGSKPERNFKLIIDVIDARANQLSWRGTGLIDADQDSEALAEEIVKAVETVWALYPPK